ncbi:phosphoglycerate kinase [Haladaptatus sp. F3-133]|jgi:phosphoglycerate kinase|uniref:Phosphoglycerate kinase n=1 Tax=Halorutilus salinus TaxID=2487751 RepID=A0A9Q4GIB4_9EURY|nr:phosphoglycerate kinase [Halorutilus salinus]MCX2818136.1 phosphoglycerate kinase [Halorutilus salinus]
MRSLDDLNAAGKTVLVRVDFNSPVDPATGRILDDKRIRGHVDTIRRLADEGGVVVLLSHQSRPGRADFTTLETHAERLSRILGREVGYVDSVFGDGVDERVESAEPGDVLLLENARFYSEEYIETPPDEAAETHEVRRLAPLFDAYVNDAFSTAHRSQPSIVGFPHRLPAYAGELMERETDVLGSLDDAPEPLVLSLGGAKVEDALGVVRNVAENGAADRLLLSGAVGNLFLVSDGVETGDGTEAFLRDKGFLRLVDEARELLDEHTDLIRLPSDVAVEIDGDRVEVGVEELPVEPPASDIGIETVAEYTATLREAGTAVVNGPPGVYEEPLFERGTEELLGAAAGAEYAVAGGGDTAAAIDALGVTGFDHVSSGGGASTAMLSGDELPGVEALDP